MGISIVFLTSCTESLPSGKDTMNPAFMKFYAGKGIGPVKAVSLSTIDTSMASKGRILFESKCITCHRMTEEKLIGPGLQGVTLRRTPEWIMNQILNPIEMAQSDSLAKELLLVYYSQMAPMGLNETEARNVLEYLRSVDTMVGSD